MSDCKYQQFLSAYHDGELDAQTHEDVHQHLQTCDVCRDQLDQIRRLSGLIRATDANRPDDAMRSDELRRIHSAVRQVQHDQPLLRIAGFMSAVAASLLIISAAWLGELPRRTPIAQPQVSVFTIDSPEWQQVAVGDYVPPVPFQTDDTSNNLPAFAQANGTDTQIVNWMVIGLSK
jgi:predicted anti-sigma-YlaC factor YlaD